MTARDFDLPDDAVASALLRCGFHVSADGTGDADGTIVARLHGELDMATAPRLGRALTQALDAKPPTLVLDLGELTLLDSTGIRVLVSAGRRAEVEGCPFILRSPRRSVLKALRLTGADRLMTIDLNGADP